MLEQRLARLAEPNPQGAGGYLRNHRKVNDICKELRAAGVETELWPFFVNLCTHRLCDECCSRLYEDFIHGEYVCCYCGMVYERFNDPLPANFQKKDNSDFGSDDMDYAKIVHDEGEYLYHDAEKEDAEAKKEGKESINFHTIKRSKDLLRMYCPKTRKSWIGRPLYLVDPKNPNKKSFYCKICREKYKNESYTNKKCWHYMDVPDLGYGEQAVLTAINAIPGKPMNAIAEYCQENYKNGDTGFSGGNVSKMIHKLAKAKKPKIWIEKLDGHGKNRTLVYPVT